MMRRRCSCTRKIQPVLVRQLALLVVNGAAAFATVNDVAAGSAAVVTRTIAKSDPPRQPTIKSFPDGLKLGREPIGKLIQVNGNAFTVIGIFEKKGGTFGNNQDDLAIIPFSTATAIYGSENMRKLVVAFQMRTNADLDLTKEQVKEILRSRHHIKKGEPDDFRILAQEEIMKTISTVLMNTTMVMAAVVGIALLVGGIGIMNIMLVSVTERTREIGIRKSIGARRSGPLSWPSASAPSSASSSGSTRPRRLPNSTLSKPSVTSNLVSKWN